MFSADRHITLTELLKRVRTTLDEAFALPLWVSAEISEIKHHGSGHCYLELVEKGDDGMPRAQARAVIWRSAYPRVAVYFEAETGQPLVPGLKILAKAQVNYHEVYGFSLTITDIDPSYTLGDMERQRQLTIASLRRDGVWDMNREAWLPSVVLRIAVVSSRQAAGYQDFCKELAKSPYAFRTTLFEALMQGQGAEASVVAALEAIAARQEAFDAVVVIRGGGSAADLNCFNGYRLCAHIAQFPLPVLTGIGHDKDTSVADMVAHTPLKTPTAVAVWLHDRAARADGMLDYAALRLQQAAVAVTRMQELRIERLRGELAHLSAALLENRRTKIVQSQDALRRSAEQYLRSRRDKLSTSEELVRSRAPERILRLGFSVVRHGGRPLQSTAGVAAGDRLDIELADGRLGARVE